ncbi:MAG: hypothetical protein V7740_17605 [Pseudomonas marincola]
MLQGKLDEAAQTTRQNLMIVGLCAIVFVMSVALFLVFTQYFSAGKEALKMASPQIEGLSPKPDLTSRADATSDPVSPVELVAKRSSKAVLSLINQFEEVIEPKITKQEFGQWNSALQQRLLREKKQAIETLAKGDVDNAFDQLTQVTSDAQDALSELESEFAAEIDNAHSALSVDAYREARIAINKALSLKTNAPEAVDLKERIEKLPEILSLIDQAHIAQTENDLYKEQQISLKISQMDPNRSAFAERAVEIENLLVEQKFEDIVIAGNEAHKSENVKTLQQVVTVARSLFPQRAETRDLEAKFLALKRKIAFNDFMINAHVAISNDNWKEALTAYNQAKTIHPNDNEVVGGIALASQIIQHLNSIQAFNNAPSRLANVTVKKSAEDTLENASTLGAISPALKTAMKQLKANVENYNHPITITVVSDGLTNVSVRGVGQVGLVSQHSIQLKPGNYRFEGKRQGYKTKSISLTITPEDTNVRVEVIADEQI